MFKFQRQVDSSYVKTDDYVIKGYFKRILFFEYNYLFFFIAILYENLVFNTEEDFDAEKKITEAIPDSDCFIKAVFVQLRREIALSWHHSPRLVTEPLSPKT